VRASDILREAAEVIEQRGLLRDKPDGERSMERAVAAYTTLNGNKMESELDGWLFMAVLKLARATAGKPHLDDLTDLAGYSALAAECLSRESEEERAHDPENEWQYTVTPEGRAFLSALDNTFKEPVTLEPEPKTMTDALYRGYEKSEDEWKPHTIGGFLPVFPDDYVDVRYRSGNTATAMRADRLDWEIWDWSGDIVAYKVVNENKED
jgi:hypothetical protein